MKHAFNILVFIVAMGPWTTAARAASLVFDHGKILLPILVAKSAAPEERAAAEELGRILGKMSGLTWSVRSPTSSEERGFYVGRLPERTEMGKPLVIATDILSPKPGETGPDGFRIQSRDGSVFIEGATPEATGYAVAWLLQREGGVRWYAPGENGEKIPRRTEWTLPDLHEVREPAYLSREISGLSTPEEKIWARHNGLQHRLEFSHALHRVFSLETFSTHPDWAPLLHGQRFVPESAEGQNWQPNLALPEAAEYAVQAATREFKRNPALKSFSLGINDTVRFDQSAATQMLVEPLHYFRGMPDYSPLVFTFMNRAAELVDRTSPDRYLGCLAYFWCENPPAFPMHSSVVPYVTTDRSQYYDRDYREADLALMSRWGASGVKAFGLWDYAYGLGFLVPRIPVEALAESVREGWYCGARGYVAEVGPQWGFDAFKTWMLAQLMWEPDRPVAALAEDFYPGYYGAAAGPMRRFFDRCEQQWMTQPGSPWWTKYYYQQDQALLFPPGTCRELRGDLADAERAAKNDPVYALHVRQTSRAFAVSEAYVAFEEVRRSIADLSPDSICHPEPPLEKMIEKLMRTEVTLRRALARATEGKTPAMTPVDLETFVRDDPVPRLLWLAGQQDFSAPRRILKAAGRDASGRVSWRALSDMIAAGQLRTAVDLVANGSFGKTSATSLEPRFLYSRFGSLPAKWTVKAMPTERGKVALLDSDPVTGQRVLRVEGAWDTQVFQWLPVEPDCAYVATARLRGRSSPGSDAALLLTYIDDAGQVVNTARMQTLPKGETPEWRTLVLAAPSVEKAAWVGVGVGATRQPPGDWLEMAAVELKAVIRQNETL